MSMDQDDESLQRIEYYSLSKKEKEVEAAVKRIEYYS